MATRSNPQGVVQAFPQGPTSNTSAATRTELPDALRGVAAITRGHGARLTVLEKRPTPRATTPYRPLLFDDADRLDHGSGVWIV